MLKRVRQTYMQSRISAGRTPCLRVCGGRFKDHESIRECRLLLQHPLAIEDSTPLVSTVSSWLFANTSTTIYLRSSTARSTRSPSTSFVKLICALVHSESATGTAQLLRLGRPRHRVQELRLLDHWLPLLAAGPEQLDQNWVILGLVRDWTEWLLQHANDSKISIDICLISYEKATALNNKPKLRSSKLQYPSQNLVHLVLREKPARSREHVYVQLQTFDVHWSRFWREAASTMGVDQAAAAICAVVSEGGAEAEGVADASHDSDLDSFFNRCVGQTNLVCCSCSSLRYAACSVCPATISCSTWSSTRTCLSHWRVRSCSSSRRRSPARSNDESSRMRRLIRTSAPAHACVLLSHVDGHATRAGAPAGE